MIPPPCDAAGVRAAGEDRDHVGAGAADLIFDRGLRARAERDHRDDGGHADDHAEHREGRAQLVARQRLERDPKGHQE